MKAQILSIIILACLSAHLYSQSENFADNYYEAQLALSQGDASKSLRLAYQLCENYPDSAKVWFLRSQIEKQSIQYKKSMESISRAIHIEPEVPAYFYLKSSLFSDLKQYDSCVSYCDSVINMDSTHLFATILKAQALSKDGKIEEAIDQFYTLHKRDSLNTTFMKQIGSLHTKNGKFLDAIQWYRKVINLDSTDILAYTHLGNLYVRSEGYEEGIPILTQGLALDTTNYLLYRFRGSLNIMGAHLEDAENDFLRAISLGDTTAFTFRHLGLSLFEQSRYPEAKSAYQKTIELDSEDSQAWYYLAFCFKWEENIERAILCMETSLKLSATPGISSVYNGLAQFHALKRDYDIAMNYYGRAYEWDPDDPVPLAQLGMLVEQTGGNKEDAKAYYESFMEKAGLKDSNLRTYVTNRLQLINEKLFMEGKLQKD